LSLGLRLLCGDSIGKDFTIEAKTPCSIGRDLSCTIRLDDKLASKHHANIGYENGKLMVTDMASMNGTFVNGRRISRKVLNAGDNVTIGSSVFNVTSGAGFSGSDSIRSLAPDEQAIPVPDQDPAATETGGLSPRLKAYMHGMQKIVIRSADEVVRQSLKKLFRLLPVSRIAIFNVAGNGRLTQGYTVFRQTSGQSTNMSRTFALKILEEKKAQLVKNAGRLQTGEFSHSIGFHDVHCIIGVPVTFAGRIRAILMGDNLEKSGALTDEHLRLMQFAGKTIEVLYQRDAVGKLDQMTRSLPICDVCKKIRDDQGYWNQLESFVSERAAVQLSQSCCPECVGKVIKG